MENVVVKNKTGMNVLLFFVSTVICTGVGTAIVYASGMLGGLNATGAAVELPRWVMPLVLPVLFFHIGLLMYFLMRIKPETKNLSVIQGWSIVLGAMLFIATVVMPFELYRNMYLGAFIVTCIMCAFSLAIAIMNTRLSVGATVVMIIFLGVSIALAYYTGMLAFAIR